MGDAATMTGNTNTEIDEAALHVGVLLKHTRKRSLSVCNLMTNRDSSKFVLRYNDLRYNMDESLYAVLPNNVHFVHAPGFELTHWKRVFYGECSKTRCVCHHNMTSISSRRPRGTPLTYGNIQAILSICDLHKRTIDGCQTFIDKIKHALGVGSLRKCQSSIDMEYERHRKMVVQLEKMTPRTRIHWAMLRRHVRMRIMARVLFSHLWGWLSPAWQVVESLPRDLQVMALRQVASTPNHLGMRA